MGDLEEMDCDNSSSPESDEEEDNEPEDETNLDNLPEKSRLQYLSRYKNFDEWRRKNLNTTASTEDVLLSFFEELAKDHLPSSLWSTYSILKTMLMKKEQVDITSYWKLYNFVKDKIRGFKSKKAEHLTAKNVSDFINNADDEDYLIHKVLLIFGVAGACKSHELKIIKTSDVKEHGQMFSVNIPDTSKNKMTNRSFIINEEFHPIVKKYMALRPKNLPTDEFFLTYRDGHCTKQVMGKNKMASIPKQIAKFLKLPNAKSYSGHCYRRTATILRSNSRGYFGVKGGRKTSDPQTDSPVQFEPCSTELSSDSSDQEESSEDDAPPKPKGPNFIKGKTKIEAYEAEYRRFETWFEKNNKTEKNEDTVLEYFKKMSEDHKPPTLWSTFSKLKLILQDREGKNLSTYSRLLQFLKDKNKGYKSPQDCKVLTPEQIRKFLMEAPDKEYLAIKVVMIFGIHGSVNRHQLVNINMTDIHELGQAFRVMVRDSKTNLCCRAFVVGSEHYPIVKKYLMLRPKKPNTDRFFINYQRGKCTKQPIGINKIAKVPKRVAEFLKLPNPETYTGRGLRKSSEAGPPKRPRNRAAADKPDNFMQSQSNLRIAKVESVRQYPAASSSQTKSPEFSTIRSVEDILKDDPEENSRKSEAQVSDLEEDSEDEEDDEDDDEDYAGPESSNGTSREYKRNGYEGRYNEFVRWRTSMNLTETNQSTLLTYFEGLSEKWKPTTMWSVFSILKTMLMDKEKLDIGNYTELTYFLKCISEGYKPKKAEVLSAQNISDFLCHAPDDKYLLTKVILIFGITGGCRNTELKRIRVTDVKEHGRMYQVSVPINKTDYDRSFFIFEEFYPIMKKYIDLRPKVNVIPCFFLNYQSGKCTRQAIGKNKMASVPKQIAEFLKLPDAKSYTSHCFRRTSSTDLATIRANLLDLRKNDEKDENDESQNSQKPTKRSSRSAPPPKRFCQDTSEETNQPLNNSIPFESCYVKQEVNAWDGGTDGNALGNFEPIINISTGSNYIDTSKNLVDDSYQEIKLNDSESDSDTEDVGNPMLSKRSKELYGSRYDDYVKWRKTVQVETTNEKVLLDYFEMLSKKYRPNTLWTIFSMLKSMLLSKEELNIESYLEVIKFLKSKQACYKKRDKNEGVLKAQHIYGFLDNAPDDKYLAAKIILIFGLAGACTTKELRSIKVNDVQEHGQIFRVNVTSSRNAVDRSFIIYEEFYPTVKKYISLRPDDEFLEDNFFLNYQGGRCTKQVIGKNKIASIPKMVAEWLNLPDASNYTGYCFRRTSASVKTNIGSDLLDLMDRSKQKNNKVKEIVPQDPLGNLETQDISGSHSSLFEPCYVKEEINTIDESEKLNSTPEVKTRNSDNKRPPPVIIKINRKPPKLMANPAENKARFVNTYKAFINWRQNMNHESTNETVLLNYFEYLSSRHLSSTLQNVHSMLKTMLILEEGIDMNQYSKVNLFLESLVRKEINLETLGGAVFTSKNFNDFINNAPDEKYLATKLILIFGIAGSCKPEELYVIRIHNVREMAPMFVISIPAHKFQSSRSFTVGEKFYSLIKKYIKLRPDIAPTNFFLKCQNGQVMKYIFDEKEIANVPKEVAEYLKLPNSGAFTGECFKLCSQTILTGPKLNCVDKDSLNNEKAPESPKLIPATLQFKPIFLRPIAAAPTVMPKETETKEDATKDSETEKDPISPVENADQNNTVPENSSITETNDDSDNDCIVIESDGGEDDSTKVERLISKSTYNNRYAELVAWRLNNKIKKTTEKTLIDYFENLSTRCAPSTLKTTHSMLKTMLMSKEKINIENFKQLNLFIKKKLVGYKSVPRCEGILKLDHIRDFLNKAPNEKYLESKVVLIIGIAGACKASELKSLKLSDVKEYGQIYHVNIASTPGKPGRAFIINEELYPFVKRYVSLRPSNDPPDFFLKYRHGRISRQSTGLHKIAGIPRQIAEYLKLPDPVLYTGQCFRKSQSKELTRIMLMNKLNIVKLEDDDDYVESCSTYPARTEIITDSQNDDSSQFESFFVKEEVNSSFGEIEENISKEPKLKKIKLTPIHDSSESSMIQGENFSVPDVVTNKSDEESDDDNEDDDFDDDSDDDNDLDDEQAEDDFDDIPAEKPKKQESKLTDKHEEAEDDFDDIPDEKPKKQKSKFTDKYEEFVDWRKTMGITQTNENTLLAYFAILSNKLEPDALLSTYSTVKMNLWTKERVNIRRYDELNQFLKRKCHGKKENGPKESTKKIDNRSSIKSPNDSCSTQEINSSDTEDIDVEPSEAHESSEAEPMEVNDNDENAEDQPLPKKSMELYVKRYKCFSEWRENMKITDTNEKTLIDYFEMLSQKFQPSSLLQMYSMLRIMLKKKENIDAKKFTKLSQFMSKKCKGYEPKKPECLSVQNIIDFLNNAPDDKFLALKVILIFGLSAGCKAIDLKRIRFKNVKAYGRMYRVITGQKNKVPVSFTIHEDFYPIIKRYIDLRPKDIPYVKDFFINYQDGRCTRQVVGQHKISKTPKRVAEYLNLPNPNSYTGHSYRQFSPLFLADVRAKLVIQDPPTNAQTTGSANSSKAESSSMQQDANSPITKTFSLPPEKIQSLIKSLGLKPQVNSSVEESHSLEQNENPTLNDTSLPNQETDNSSMDSSSL